jgi:hypothetical protein
VLICNVLFLFLEIPTPPHALGGELDLDEDGGGGGRRDIDADIAGHVQYSTLVASPQTLDRWLAQQEAIRQNKLKMGLLGLVPGYQALFEARLVERVASQVLTDVVNWLINDTDFFADLRVMEVLEVGNCSLVGTFD